MSVKHLRTLVAIADSRTFSEAASSVNLTHAAVSQHVNNLETEVGVPLFDRTSRTPVLNATGRSMVEKARRVLADYDNLIPSVRGTENMSLDLMIGAVPTVLTGLAPRAILRLKHACPHLRLLVRPGLTSALLTSIERNQLDAAIVTQPRVMPLSLRFEPIADEPLMLIVSPEVDSNDPVDLLKSQPFIRFNRDAVVGAAIEAWLQKKRIQVNETMELANLDAISSMVHANIGVSIVPRTCAEPFNPLPLRWLPLEDNALVRRLGLAYRRHSPDAWALDEVVAACRASRDDAADGR